MDPVTAITTIYSIYDAIKTKAELVVANREQFQLLSVRCGDIVQSLRDVMESSGRTKNLRQGSLQTLLATLTKVEEFITMSRFTETEQGGIYYRMLEIYYSNEDKAKFRELNDALSQNMHDCNFAIGVANLQQKMDDSARKDRTNIEKTLVDVFGGSNIKLDNESEVNAFLGEHRQIKSILDRLTDD